MSEEDQECTHEYLVKVAAAAMCEFVKQYCDDKEVVDLYYYKACFLPQSTLGSILFYASCLGLMLMAFYLLGRIASTYLTPVLTKISLALKLSETISGVTLLAFANGAPDIISAYAAGGSSGGIFITIGNLFGAGLFCSTLVVAKCIQSSSRKIQMEREQWNRDLVFYIFAALLLIIYGSVVEYISYWMCGGFFVIYLVYISVVIYQEKTRPKEDDALIEPKTFKEQHDADKHKLEQKLAHPSGLKDSMVNADQPKARRLSLTMAEVKNVLANTHQHKEEPKKEVAQAESSPAEEEEEETPLSKAMDIVTFPIRLLPTVTIPNLDEDKEKNPLIILTPLTAGLIFTFLKNEFSFTAQWKGINAMLITTIVTIPFCCLVYYLKNVKKSSAYEWVLVPFALVASIIWLKTSAGSIVDMISFTSNNFGVNKVLLGATFLGIGNSLADFFANSSLAALGYGVMACTGSISGQLFNFLMSIPINIMNSLNKNNTNKETFDLLNYETDKVSKVFALMIIWLVVGQVVFLLFMSISNDYVLNLRLAKINLIVYIACYILFFTMAFVVKEDAAPQ